MDKQKVKQKPDDSDSNIQQIQLENRQRRLEKQEIPILKKVKLPEPPLPISTSLLQLLSFKKN